MLETGRRRTGPFSRALRILCNDGLHALLRRATERARDLIAPTSYRRWVARFDVLTEGQHAQMRADIARWQSLPLISVVMSVRDADPRHLTAAVRSVQAQLYPRWELCICEGTEHETGAVLRGLADEDRRLRLSAASEGAAGALALARGEHVALLDGHDLIPAHALYWVVREIVSHADADLIFTDEDLVDDDGRRSNPWFKPDWNPALMLSCDAFGRLGVFRRRLLQEIIGAVRPGDPGGSNHDLVLRCAAGAGARVRHIPRILYHRRRLAGGAGRIGPEADVEAVRRMLDREGLRAQARGTPHGCQVEYSPPVPPPRVSILLPSLGEERLLAPCLETLLGKTTYENFETLLLVAERHRDRLIASDRLARLCADPRLRVLAYPDRPFNYSWINNWGAAQASGDLICLLNDDTTVITPAWLERLAARVLLPGVAAAGPLLLYPDDTIQHAGVILGLGGGVAGHACHMRPKGDPGPGGRCVLEQDVSCLTAACLLLRAAVLREVGGLDEALPIAFNDVDLCLRLRATGWRLIFTPTVELCHHESSSVGPPGSRVRGQDLPHAAALMRERWGRLLDCDPCYNPNLSLRRAYALAFPPRLERGPAVTGMPAPERAASAHSGSPT
jgi:glycosyltransferase involved in cell wall biosynthesis